VNAFRNFITQLDKKAVRAIGIMLLMFLLVFTMIGYGRAYLGISESDINTWLQTVRGTVWALPLTILIFTLAAFVGVPQWMLIAGAVIAFGPAYGAGYSWVSTMLSASLNFWIGHWVGAERLKKYGGDLVNRMAGLVRKNGFVTSFTVRLVPTGPFVLVNMAAGVSRMTFLAFLMGTGLGIIPKILAVAFLGKGIFDAFAQQGYVFIAISFAIALALLIIMLIARKRLSSAHLDGNGKIGE
jgi:uncharacterized membrane protein YdjX (TVP38/TMEM64 family)